MMLAGKRWLVTEIIFDKKLVLVVNSPGKKLTRFGSAFGEIHTRVMQEMKKVLMDNDEPRISIQTAKHFFARLARRLASSGWTQRMLFLAIGKAFSGFRGSAHAPCGRFRYSPIPRKLSATQTSFQSLIIFHRRKNFTRISAKSLNPTQTQLRSPASCRTKPSKNSMNSPPNSCLMKPMQKADWIFQAQLRRANTFWKGA
jgi:hypothetical protein